MLKIYGTLRCPDCVECLEALDKAKIDYEFLDFDKDLKALKEFLKIRDSSELFNEAREAGNIGIPCIIKEDESITLDWNTVM